MAIGDAIGMASKLTLKCMDLERKRDEAIRSCHIWQTGHAELVKERDRWIRLYDSATAEREELRKALSLAGRRCNQIHHPKSMQHGDSDPCPVEKFIEQLLWKQPK